MGESTSTFSTKDRKHRKLWQIRKRQFSDDPLSDTSRSSNNDSCKSLPDKTQSKTKSVWKNFFGIFGRTSVDKSVSNSTCQYKRDLSRYMVGNTRKEDISKDQLNDIYISDVNDEFAIAISLPEDINGKDVLVSIELNANQDLEGSTSGLAISEVTSSRTIFTGNIKLPCNTTIETISKMPLYFINAKKTAKPDGNHCHKIETFIKPLDDNLPSNIDKTIVVSDINLKVKLQNISKSKKWNTGRFKPLNYMFIPADLISSKSQLHIKTEDIVEEISKEKQMYNEESKTIVKDILCQVVKKVGTHDISTQYSKIITSVNKEIDVQKSLLIQKKSQVLNIKSNDLLSIITERDEDESYRKTCHEISDDSVYPKSTTTSSLMVSDSLNSLDFIKAPMSTPNVDLPRYIIQCDNYLKNMDNKHWQRKDLRIQNGNSEKSYEIANIHYVSLPTDINVYDGNTLLYRQLLQDNVKADIDKTLELLEMAKNKLVNYLDNSLELAQFSREFKYKYPTDCLPKEYSTRRRDKCGISLYDHNKDHKKNSTELIKCSDIDSRAANNDDKQRETICHSPTDQFFRCETKNGEEKDLISFSKENIPADIRSTNINTNQNIYNTVITIDGNVLYRSRSQRMHDDMLKQRYSEVGHETGKLAYSIVENDINIMIQELLKESNTIKEYVLDHTKVPDMGPPQEAVILEVTIEEDVKSVLSMLLDRVEEALHVQTLVGELDEPSLFYQPVYVNYCLIDEKNSPDNTKALIQDTCSNTDPYTHHGPVLAKPHQNYEIYNLPKISVRRVGPRRKHHILKSQETLLQKLERSTAFLKQIYNEVCEVNSRVSIDDDEVTVNNYGTQQETTSHMLNHTDGTSMTSQLTKQVYNVECITEASSHDNKAVINDDPNQDEIEIAETLSVQNLNGSDNIRNTIGIEQNIANCASSHENEAVINDDPNHDKIEIAESLSIQNLNGSDNNTRNTNGIEQNIVNCASSHDNEAVINDDPNHDQIEIAESLSIQNLNCSDNNTRNTNGIEQKLVNCEQKISSSNTITAGNVEKEQFTATNEKEIEASEVIITAPNRLIEDTEEIEINVIHGNYDEYESSSWSEVATVSAQNKFIGGVEEVLGVAIDDYAEADNDDEAVSNFTVNANDVDAEEVVDDTMNKFSTDDHQNPPPMFNRFLLKKSVRIGENFMTFNIKDYPIANSSQDEVIQEEVNLNSPIHSKESKFSTYSRKRSAVGKISSSSSEETVLRVKAMIKARQSPSLNFSNRAYGNHMLSVSYVTDSDYDADSERTTIAIPYIKHEYVSTQELNNKEEIAYIEENVKINNQLHVESDKSLINISLKGKRPLIYESTESLATSFSLESESSGEMNHQEEYVLRQK